MIEYRNPKYSATGGIDVEINHPTLGWIPFHATLEDVEGYGRDLFRFISEHDTPAPYVPPRQPLEPAPYRVSSRQFGLQLIENKIFDKVQEWVAAQDAKVKWAFERSAEFDRRDEMIQKGFKDLGFAPEDVEEFFRKASKL